MANILSNFELLDILSIYQTLSDSRQNRDITNKQMLETLIQISLVLEFQLKDIKQEILNAKGEVKK